MSEDDFDGSLVLEKLAEIGVLDEFYSAVDSDDFKKAKSLMKAANVNNKLIATVLKKMENADWEH